jgi:hypothetical protein
MPPSIRRFLREATLPALLLLVVLSAAAAPPLRAAPPVPPGEYNTENGWGTLTVERGADGGTTFSLEVLGANGHTCGLEGEIKNGRATLEAEEPDKPCIVLFQLRGSDVDVTAQDSDLCRYYCGVRAGFEALYLRPTPGCSPAERNKTREEFKRLYDQKAWPRARATLEPVLARCEKIMHPVEAGWVRNDLAVTLHKLGLLAECREILKPLAADAALTDEEIATSYPPADADAYLPLARATRTNLKLCSAAGAKKKP